MSRDAQKKLVGGEGGGKTFDVSCSAAPGYHIESPGACTGTLTACRSAANAWCGDINNHCLSCTVS